METFPSTLKEAFAQDPQLWLRLLVTAFCFYVLYEVYVYVARRDRRGSLLIMPAIDKLTEALLTGVGALVGVHVVTSDDNRRHNDRR